MPLNRLSLESSTEEISSSVSNCERWSSLFVNLSYVEDLRISVSRGMFLRGGLEIDIVFIRSPTEICNNRIYKDICKSS